MNNVTLSGRLVSEPDFRQTQEGTAVCSFRIAVKRPHMKDKSDFISCVAWRNTADFVNKYFVKGQRIEVSGTLQSRDWTDNNGNKRYATEVVCDYVDFGDTKKERSAVSAPSNYAPEFSDFGDAEDLPFD